MSGVGIRVLGFRMRIPERSTLSCHRHPTPFFPLGRGSLASANRFLGHNPLQVLQQLGPGAMQPAPYGSYGNVQNL